MRYEILLQTGDWNNPTDNPSYFYLDTFEDVSISLNYNIADITDISRKKSGYSKTIDLPDTDKNRQIFSNIFDLDIDLNRPAYASTFNPNKKVKCIVLKDGLTQFDGNLQLTNINYNFDTNRHIYQVVIYADNDGLFKNIGEKYLSDLDLSEYDHIYNIDNIKKSWGLNGGDSTWTNGYFYPLIDYGFPLFKNQPNQTNPITFDKFYTAIYAKVIFNKIFSEAGYSYKSEFLDSVRFTDTIIPFNNKNFTGTPLVTTGTNGEVFQAGKNNITTPQATFGQQGNAIAYFYTTSLNCNVDNFDPNNLYATASGLTGSVYTNPLNETFKIKFNLYIKLQTTSYAADNFWNGLSDDIDIYVKRSRNIDGSTNSFWNNQPTYNRIYNPTEPGYFRDVLINGGQGISARNVLEPAGSFQAVNVGGKTWDVTIQVTTDWMDTEPLLPGEQVRFFVTRYWTAPFNNPVLDFRVKGNTTVTGIIDLNTAIFGSNISIKNTLPSKVKQKDFLISIFKMFNLYIEPSKNNINEFIIEPRDDYYRLYGRTKDWSDKVDFTQDITSDILSNLQKRTNLFTYKEDKDIYNTNYKTSTNEIYGQFRYELDNDFISDENKIEPIFSPTPIDELKPTGSSIYLPIIANFNNGNYSKMDGMNIRILYRQLIQNNNFIINVNTTQTFTPGFYPYAGPSNDPLNPIYTLNFGSVNSFYNGYNDTLNNLVNNFYRNQISELNDINSRLFSLSLYLSPYDINDFRFSDLIFLNFNNMSSYYRVNKIIDYDPSKLSTTKVELIKAFNYNLDFDLNGATPSTEFCWVRMAFNLSPIDSLNLLNVITSYAGSLYPYLTFYNTYDNTPFSYPYPVSEGLGYADLEMWASSLPPSQGFSIDYNSVDGSQTIAQKVYVPCNTGPYELRIVMSTLQDAIIDVNPIVTSSPDLCECDTQNRVNAYFEGGLLNPLPIDNILVGVVNTSTSNKTTFPNVAMIGSNNSISSVGVMTIGENNSSFGDNSLLIGLDNQSTSRQSLVIGDNNIVNGINSLALGSNNEVSSAFSFVLGYGNQLPEQQPQTYTYSLPGTNSVFGTYSQTPTQSSFVVGNENIILGQTNIIFGNSNLIGPSVSNSLILGENNIISFTQTGLSDSVITYGSINGGFIFGNNNNISNIGSQSSLDSLFVFGNNVSITQSGTSSLFYIGSDTIEINTQNIITNVVGTASFNKMTIAELTIKDDIYYTPNFVFNQYNPSDYPNGSYLYFNSPIPDLEIAYQNLDGSKLSLINYAVTGNNVSELVLDEASVRLRGNDQTNSKEIRNDNTLYYHTGLTYGSTTSVIVAGYDKIFTDGISLDSTNERSMHFLNISSTSSVIQNYNLVVTNNSVFTMEANIVGADDPNFYFSKKIASFANNTQIGTTKTIFENTNFATYSVDLNVDGDWANLAVSGGATQNVSWKVYTKLYFH